MVTLLTLVFSHSCPSPSHLPPFLTFGSTCKHPIISPVQPGTAFPSHPIRYPTSQQWAPKSESWLESAWFVFLPALVPLCSSRCADGPWHGNRSVGFYSGTSLHYLSPWLPSWDSVTWIFYMLCCWITCLLTTWGTWFFGCKSLPFLL